ncbi:MAG: energy transducer TonB, partial [Albidovulum sp.]
MDRSQRIGMIVSGVAHLGVILWLILGGIFFSHDLPPTVATTEVSLMSSAEFAAMQARAPTAPIDTPEQPTPPATAESTPAAPAVEPVPEALQPPEPDVVSEPDAAPEPLDPTPPAAEVTDAPPSPPIAPVEVPSEVVLDTI